MSTIAVCLILSALISVLVVGLLHLADEITDNKRNDKILKRARKKLIIQEM